MRIHALAAVALLFCCGARADVAVLAAGDGHKPVALPVAEFAWFEGRWLGQALGGEVEEVWLPAGGGTMVGIYRLVKDGRVVFYEIMTLGPSGGNTAMRLKHFHANLEGWEERTEVVEFPLLRVEPGIFYFDGMTMVRRGADELDVHLRIDDRKSGKSWVEVFHYRRSAPVGGN